MESDAEWIDVDTEFGDPETLPRPKPCPRPCPTDPPATERPHDAPEKAPSSPAAPASSNAGLVAGSVGGLLGIVLLLLLVYMAVLRRRLSKAKDSGRESRYQLRVEDVAHLSHLDVTTNTYVNTTDLQKLVASVRAKGKSEGRLPVPPRLHYQTPAPYRPPAATRGDNDIFQGDKVVVRAPMPPPCTTAAPSLLSHSAAAPQPVQEVMYSNLEEIANPPRPAPRLQAPRTSPPPPPTKEFKFPVASPARPAPAPPKPSTASQASGNSTAAQTAKPTPPCPIFKPGKGAPSVLARPGAKPTPPTLPKPSTGKALPPLKIVLPGTVKGASSSDTCATPDTAQTHLSQDTTPIREDSPALTSISAKIALLEGHMHTPGGGMPRPGVFRP